MAQDEPSLSNRYTAGGPGALFPQAQGPDLSNSIQRAAAWLMAPNTEGKSLGALQGLQNETGNTREYNLNQQAMATVYRGLRDAGLPHEAAMAGAMNPTYLKELSPESVKVGEGPLGAVMGLKQGFKISGLPGAASVGNADEGLTPVLKPGVKYDPAIQGQARVDQFKPEYAAAIKAYKNGDSMPTGKGDKYTQFIKREAQAWAEAEGETFNEQTFSQKRTALNDLAKSNPSSSGGQAILGRTALEHLAEVSDAYKGINNKGLSEVPVIGSIPGSGMVSRGFNALGNSTAAAGPAKTKLEDAITRQVEESSKYYAGSQAAQTERERVRSLYDTNLQPAEAVSLMKSERNLMADKIEQAIGQLSSTLGPQHPKVLEQRQLFDKALAKVDAKIAELAGGTPTKAGTLPDGWSVKVK